MAAKGKGGGGWKRGLLRGLLALVILSVLLAAAWTMLLPGIAVSIVQARTGFGVKADKVSVNPFTGRMACEGLVLTNPAGWPAPEFLVLRQFTLEAELLPLLRDRLVADKLVIDIGHLALVRNKDGRTNAEAFREAMASGRTPPAERPPADFLIRRLTLKFDRLTIADHTGRKPAIKDYELLVERELTDVDTVAKLVHPFLGVALNATRGLYDVAPAGMPDSLNSSQRPGKKAGGPLKNFLQSLEKGK